MKSCCRRLAYVKRYLGVNLSFLLTVVVGSYMLWTVPQVSNVLFQIPSFVHSYWHAVGYVAFLITVICYYAVSPFLISPYLIPSRCLRPRWLRPPAVGRVPSRRVSVGRDCLIIAFMFAWPAGAGELAGFGAKWQRGIGPVLQEMVLWLLLVGLWFLCLPGAASAARPHVFRRMTGLVLLWWVIPIFTGQLLWWLAGWANAANPTSYRLYTIWGVLHILGGALMAAALLDCLNRNSALPIRLVAAVVIGILVWLGGPQPVRDGEVTSAEPKPAEWLDRFAERMDSVAADEPVILVAASGGGSRAAIFAALVLEALAREPYATVAAPNRSWSDHVILITSVSGGSLATAHFVVRDGKRTALQTRLANSMVANLQHAMSDHLLARALNLDREPEPDRALLARCLHSALVYCRARGWFDAPDVPAVERWLQAHPASAGVEGAELDWIVQNRFMDAMCTDFMAPIVRGLITPLSSRDQMLRIFWNTEFGWEGIRNSDFRRQMQGTPLAIFNACNVDGGSRLAVGFPPLPRNFIDGQMTRGRARTRNPAQSLADLGQSGATGLGRAVRLSSNFPWGFRVSQLRQEGTTPVNVLDGGLVDNTGIDTLCEVLRGMTKSQRGEQLLLDLAMHDSVLIEIDSGAKPARSGRSPEVLMPIEGLNNALYTNAEISKAYLLKEMRGFLNDRVQQEAEKDGGAQATDLARGLANHFDVFTFRCESFEQDEPGVMTAWALGPEDKARVLARFLVEYIKWKITFVVEYRQLQAQRRETKLALRRLLGSAYVQARLRQAKAQPLPATGAAPEELRSAAQTQLDWLQMAQKLPDAGVERVPLQKLSDDYRKLLFVLNTDASDTAPGGAMADADQKHLIQDLRRQTAQESQQLERAVENVRTNAAADHSKLPLAEVRRQTLGLQQQFDERARYTPKASRGRAGER